MDHEFPNNLYAPLQLAAKGVRFRPVPSPPGTFDADYFLDALGPHTRLVILSSVTIPTASGHPWRRLRRSLGAAAYCYASMPRRASGVLCHDVRTTPADFLIVHGYKWMLGPSGAGFFYAPPETREWLAPTVVSWRSHKGWRNHEQLHHGRPESAGDAAMYEGGVQAFALLFAL